MDTGHGFAARGRGARNPGETGRRGAVRLDRLLDRRDRAVVTAATDEGDVEAAEHVAGETGASAGT